MYCALCATRAIDWVDVEVPSDTPSVVVRQIAVCWRCLSYDALSQLMSGELPYARVPHPTLN